MSPLRARARSERLLLRELPEELLVYDLDRHRAVCLNRPAALVFRLCDGTREVERLAEDVSCRLDAAFDTTAVWLALDRLERERLLEPLPETSERPRWSRREWLRRLGRAGVQAALVPAVVAIVAPTAAQAASVVTMAACDSANPSNCPGVPCVDMGMAMGNCVLFDPSMMNPRCMCS